MLVLRRKPTQLIRINDDIEIQILDIHSNQVRLGFHAPPTVRIVREEVLKRDNQIKNINMVNMLKDYNLVTL